MKKMSFKLMLFATLFIIVYDSSFAQVYVYVPIRPPVPVIVRPSQPGPVYVWINEEWEPYRGAYRYSGGHWAPPPQKGYYRRAGYWKHSSKGQRWVQGSWYKKQPGNKGKHKGRN